MAQMKSLLISSLFSLLITRNIYVGGDFQSAGCSDEGCGIPCYLRPAEDECHYTPQDPCSAGDADDLANELSRLNSSIVRLQEKLIQKGVSKCVWEGGVLPSLPTVFLLCFV